MKITLTLAAAYLASVVAAAYAVTHIGAQYAPGAPHVVPVWPGIEAPSGVYVIGVTLVIRDLLQHRITKPGMVGLIAAGAGLAALVSPAVAVASGCAFLLSETVDWVVYTLTEKRIGDWGAVLASNAVSIVVDSIVFLTVAFGSLAFLQGQVIGKALATIAALAVVIVIDVIQARRPETLWDALRADMGEE